MRVLLVSIAILFVSVQFIIWLKSFFIPLPFYILGGASLALASNYENNLNDFLPSIKNYLPKSNNN